ncbi:50S ribosomal protein L22 [Candidatus Falkowbacteria bacterium HGW-Falkowbacteria-2]|uniref:Large ribosomal subunit protein uL22 n=1 Tax=Candidatus Falkowbacteria bacterium HGW-Falkowbacteria-2 TaxID=2013769 RepID=A0A2N2E344_9BACT|nr:MAG: 50S ribosomal protein L22 [Candidatus Falkowbacteria bacterium HGW-Falkowbacteria-2]
MEIKASLNHLRMGPRKVRLVVDVVRGMTIDKSLDQLQFLNKLAADPVKKLILSAVANAEHNFSLAKDNLYIKEIKVDGGVTLKRWMPKAHGRATVIRKRGSHVHVTLAEIVESGKKEARKDKVDAPVKLETVVAEAEKRAKSAKKDGKSSKDGGKVNADVKSGKGFTNKVFNRKVGS